MDNWCVCKMHQYFCVHTLNRFCERQKNPTTYKATNHCDVAVSCWIIKISRWCAACSRCRWQSSIFGSCRPHICVCVCEYVFNYLFTLFCTLAPNKVEHAAWVVRFLYLPSSLYLSHSLLFSWFQFCCEYIMFHFDENYANHAVQWIIYEIFESTS